MVIYDYGMQVIEYTPPPPQPPGEPTHPINESHSSFLDIPMVDTIKLFNVGVSHLLDPAPIERTLAHCKAVVLRGGVNDLICKKALSKRGQGGEGRDRK